MIFSNGIQSGIVGGTIKLCLVERTLRYSILCLYCLLAYSSYCTLMLYREPTKKTIFVTKELGTSNLMSEKLNLHAKSGTKAKKKKKYIKKLKVLTAFDLDY